MATPTEVRIKLPGSAYLPVILLAACVTAVAQHPWALLIYLLPVTALIYVARTATIARPAGITARALIGSQYVPWDSVRGFSTDERGRVHLALTDGRLMRLPCVRPRHLAALALVSGGRLDAPV